MVGFIDGYDFGEMEAMRYYAPPASWSEQRKKDLVRNRIYGQDFLGAEKKDGFFAKFVKDDNGDILLYSRSRNVQKKYVNKVDWIPHLHNFFSLLPNGTCLLGELYLPSSPGSHNVTSILGCLKEKAVARQEKDSNKLRFYIFDVLAYDGKSLLETPAEVRFLHYLPQLKQSFYAEPFVEFAIYHQHDMLWDNLLTYLESGGEGYVITAPKSVYEPGKRPSRTTLKVKQEITTSIDCVVIGALPPTKFYTGKQLVSWPYWEDTKTGETFNKEMYEFSVTNPFLKPITHSYYNKWAGSLKLGLYDESDKITEIGSISGLPDEVLSNWRNYIGKVLTVTAMDIYKDTMRLRHPKSLGFREDKAPKECTIDQIK